MLTNNLGLSQDLIDEVSRIVEASCSARKMEKEELHPNQVKLDKNKNGKLDADDFKKLRDEEETDEGFVSNAQRKAVWASKNEKGVKEAKDGWSKNDSLAKPTTSSQAMANYSQYFTKVTKLDSNGNPKKPEKSVKEDLDEASIVGQAKHLVKGIKRLAAGKPSAGASERDADAKGRQRYADSEGHSRAAGAAAYDFGPNRKRVVANRMSAAKYNMKKGAHQFKRADRIAALRDKVKNEDVYLEDYSLEEIQDFLMSEDFEQLDELSKNTLTRYADAAKDDKDSLQSYGASTDNGTAASDRKLTKHLIKKRTAGINLANKKLSNEDVYLEDYSLEELQDFMMSEDFEQLDELSKNTLGSYVKKAANSLSKASHDLGDKRAQAAEVDRFTNRHMGDKFRAQGKMKDDLGVGNSAQEKDLTTVLKRTRGITKAANKLTKEQVEEIELLAAKHGLGE